MLVEAEAAHGARRKVVLGWTHGDTNKQERRKGALRWTRSGLGGGEKSWKSCWLRKESEPDWVRRSGEEVGQIIVQIRYNYPN